MTRIELYDTTLRDGMQGEGMSLSAGEKLRVAHRLDELGIDVIEAGFPSSNPKELELFELLSRERFEHAEIAAFGMTRRRDLAAEDDPALRVLADCFAPVCTLVGKTWSLHLEKVVKVDRVREPADDRRVDRVPGRRRQAGDLRRRALLRRLRRRPRVRAGLPACRRAGRGRDGRLLRHERRHAAGRDHGGDRRGDQRGCRRACGWRSTPTTTPAVPSPTRSRRSSPERPRSRAR